MTEPTPITVQILDKEYLIGCPEDDKEALLAAAKQLDRRMREVRDSGKVIGNERIAVITALNLTHELLDDRARRSGQDQEISEGVQRIYSKLDAVLQRDNSSQQA